MNESTVISICYLVLLGILIASVSYWREGLLLGHRPPSYMSLGLLRLLCSRYQLLKTLSLDFVPTISYILHV